jgi:hypothetical protein
MEKKFDTDEQLRNSLRDFEAIPDSSSFDAIIEKMARKKKRRIFFMFFWTGLTAFTGITLSLLVHPYESGKTSSIMAPAIHMDFPTRQNPETSSPEAVAKHPLIQGTESSNSTPGNTSLPKTTSQVAKAGTTLPGKQQASINASVTQASLAKQHSEKPGFEQNNTYSVSSKGKALGTTDKNDAEMNAVEKTGQFRSNSTKASQNVETIPVSVHLIQAIYMPVIQATLPVDSVQPEVIASLHEGSYPALFLVPEKKNSFSFYLGAQASPQLNSFVLSRNPNRDPAYHASGSDFPDFYLDKKNGQSRFNFSVPFGIKAGVTINKKYEVFAGVGYQVFTEKEKLFAVSPSTITSIVDPGIAYSTAAGFSMPYKNNFRYMYYSLEANRIFLTSKTIAFKVGLGLYGNQLLNSSYVFAMSPNTYGQAISGRQTLSPWLLTTKVKAGVIFNANKRFQCHISPGFFYSPTSVFKRDYVIRQKPFGFDIECMILFRLFKI